MDGFCMFDKQYVEAHVENCLGRLWDQVNWDDSHGATSYADARMGQRLRRLVMQDQYSNNELGPS
jgi:hypothetical protein